MQRMRLMLDPRGAGGAVGRRGARPVCRRCGVFRMAGAAVLLGGVAGCQPAQGPPPAAATTPEVAVVIVQPEPLQLTTILPGRTAAFLVAEIRPQVNGLIQKRLFEEGSDVEAGQVLYQIDPAPFEAALASADAALARADAAAHSLQLRAKRYGELIEERAISQQDYDDAQAGVLQAEAEILYARAAVDTARINLGYTRITAPIAGRIGRSSVTDGALVTAFQPVALATIQQLDPVYVDVPQSTTQLLDLQQRIEQGRIRTDEATRGTVNLLLADGTQFDQIGALQFRDVSVDPSTGSVILRAVFPNPDAVLLPGMFVRAEIHEGVNERAILIPQQGVDRNARGEPFVLVVDDVGMVAQRPIVVDRAVGNRWLVSEGLQPGDRVIVEGAQGVRPGATAQAVPFDPDRPPGPGGPPAAGAPPPTS